MTHRRLLLTATALLALAGCDASPSSTPGSSGGSGGGEQHGHDHGPPAATEHTRSFESAVARTKVLQAKIAEAFADDDLAAADGPVHELIPMLEIMPVLASRAALPGEEQAKVNHAIGALAECFGQLDATLHGREGKTYQDVAERVERNLATLEAAAGGGE